MAGYQTGRKQALEIMAQSRYERVSTPPLLPPLLLLPLPPPLHPQALRMRLILTHMLLIPPIKPLTEAPVAPRPPRIHLSTSQQVHRPTTRTQPQPPRPRMRLNLMLLQQQVHSRILRSALHGTETTRLQAMLSQPPMVHFSTHRPARRAHLPWQIQLLPKIRSGIRARQQYLCFPLE